MTITINAKTDLTYEEIYEGHANGKSRLPKILKEIENGTNALAEEFGINILRRRTGGGNSTNVSGIGISVSDPVAKLISSAHYDDLITNYSNPSWGRPSQNFIDADVRGVTKNPFDLIDFVSGIDNADQLKGSGDALATRAAKLKAIGSNVVIRDFTELVQGNINVRDRFGDRVGVGGATGEVHGVDQNIPDIMTDTGSQAKVVGSVDGSSGLDMTADTTLSVDINRGSDVDIVYTNATLSLGEVSNETNEALGDAIPDSEGAAFVKGNNVVLRSDRIGGGGVVKVNEANTAIGFATQETFGETSGAYGVDGDDDIITVSSEARDVKNRIRYGTFQFGTLRIFTSINNANPVAYIVHPDLLTDLELNQ